MKPSSPIPLLDADLNLPFQEVDLPSPSRPAAAWSLRSRILHGGLQEGVQTVEIDNGLLRLVVLPSRGMGIFKAEKGGLRLGWDSPVKKPVHPQFVNLQERSGLGWLRGFNEWIVRCGLSSMGAPGTDRMLDNNGNPAEEQLTLHGKIANLPAHKLSVEVTEEDILLRGEVDESMLFGPALRLQTEIRVPFGSAKVIIQDTVTNLGHTPAEHQLLYHVNYGPPLLEAGARFLAPFKRMAPRDARAAQDAGAFDRYAAPQAGYVEQVYFFELAGKARTRETLVMLRNAKGDQASTLRYRLGDFPCFSLWKNTAAREDGYVTGLEPATAFPNPRQFERSRGRVILLAGGESRSTSLTVEALDTRKAVQAAEQEIRSLQKQVAPKSHPEPIPVFSDI